MFIIPRPFFELCDGIFLNYLWKVPQLQASATLAGHRKGDVYVGVDVFGRGCYGGGGYNTNKVYYICNFRNCYCSYTI